MIGEHSTVTGDLRIAVREAPEWTALFRREAEWTGGDGIYAIPLSGYEGPGRASAGRQVFVFGDTFIGRVDPATGARRDFDMVYNTLAYLDGGQPDAERIQFVWGKNGSRQLRSPQVGEDAVFPPSTPQAQGAGTCWYWLQDGLALADHMYLMPMLVRRDPAGPPGFQFADFGVCLLKIPIAGNGLDLARHAQIDAPFFHCDDARKLYFGAAFVPNTSAAGAPNPDGHIYAYGRYHGVGDPEIQLAVARVAEANFEDFAAWRFWDGAAWNADIAATAPLGRGGAEFSVTPVASGPLAGKYLLVSMHVERDLYIRIGDSPVGPFGPRIDIYRTSEEDDGQSIYTYNAKAHPSLSPDDAWLVSYNVNTRDWDSHVANGDIYRPRFLWVRFGGV